MVCYKFGHPKRPYGLNENNVNLLDFTLIEQVLLLNGWTPFIRLKIYELYILLDDHNPLPL
jgi:hypothetical protein